MKSKKAILTTNAITAIIAVIGIVGLAYLLYQIYSQTALSEEEKSAQKVIDKLSAELDTIPENLQVQKNVQGFNHKFNWHISAFTTENPNRPSKCGLKNCICICQEDCSKKSICRPADYQIKIESFEIFDVEEKDLDGIPTGQVETFRRSSDQDKIFISSNFIQIDVNKFKQNENVFVEIKHYSPEYITRYGKT